MVSCCLQEHCLHFTDGHGPSNLRSSPKLGMSTEKFVGVSDYAPNYVAQWVEEYIRYQRDQQLHPLRVVNIPKVEKEVLKIHTTVDGNVNMDASSDVSTRRSIFTKIFDYIQLFSAISYGLFGDASVGGSLREEFVRVLRLLANWVEAHERKDISKVCTGRPHKSKINMFP